MTAHSARTETHLSRRLRPAKWRGFSLVEVCVVIAISGVLAALALPAVQTMVQTRASSIEVAKVHATLEGARDDARAQLRCIRVRTGSASTLLLEELEPVPVGCGAVVANTKVASFNGRAVQLASDIDLTFTRSGSVAGAIDPQFTVTGLRPDAPSRAYTFRVYRVLGLVRRT